MRENCWQLIRYQKCLNFIAFSLQRNKLASKIFGLPPNTYLVYHQTRDSQYPSSIPNQLIAKFKSHNTRYGKILQVQLPKFKIESTHENLAIALQGLGLATMFDRSAANFSGISNTQLWVDTAIQKAFIQVLPLYFQLNMHNYFTTSTYA